MLLPKPKLHIPRTTLLRRLPNLPGSSIRSTKINPHISRRTALQPAHITAIQNPIPHSPKQLPKIRSPEISATLQLGQRIHRSAHTIQINIRPGILIHALGQIGMDAQKLGAMDAIGRFGRLRLETRQQGLEPLETGRIPRDPDELHAAEALRRIRARAQMPDVLQDAGPGRDADARADEDGDLVVEDVFGRRAVRPVDADRRHGLARLQRDFVHPVRIQGVVFFGLGGAGAERVTGCPGPVPDLAHVDADVGVEGAGGDGEGVPLVGGDRGDVDEEPLPRFVFHAWFGELDLHSVVGMADDFEDLGASSGSDFSVDSLHEVDPSGPEFPAPALVSDAVCPEHVATEGGVGDFGVADEAAGGVGVEGEEEGDEEVVRVPEGFEGLLADSGVCGCVHEEHAEEHYMACYATRLSVVDLDGGDWAKLGFLNVEEAGWSG